ncbi:hypothetical protein SynSYN20_00101 [Synechococcus sp. SYN20]|nr:hypothetical protein SynSYN20_00101 [Synechococcus sp. SYN20]
MNWPDVLSNMIRITRPKGLVIITCAGAGRPTHGTLDSEIDSSSSPFTSDYYKNLGVNDIASAISLEKLFENHGFEVNSKSHDLYFWGIRSEVTINEIDGYWEDTLSRLARAQGQIGQAAARQAALKSELEKAKCEAEQSKKEAEQARAEARQAQAITQQAQAEAQQARAEAEQARAEA